MLARRCSLSRMDLVRRLLDKAKGLPPGQVVMITGFLNRNDPSEEPIDTKLRQSWLVLNATGNELRVRRMRVQTLMYTHWTQSHLFPKSKVTDPRFYIATLRPEHLPPSV